MSMQHQLIQEQQKSILFHYMAIQMRFCLKVTDTMG